MSCLAFSVCTSSPNRPRRPQFFVSLLGGVFAIDHLSTQLISKILSLIYFRAPDLLSSRTPRV